MKFFSSIASTLSFSGRNFPASGDCRFPVFRRLPFGLFYILVQVPRFVKNTSNNNKKNSKKARFFPGKPLAFFRRFCYYIKAFRTGADFPHVAALEKRLGGRAEAPGGIKTKKENNKWQSYP
ncbi:MAG: hypothetical protein IKD61_08160 [Oscillospiraceae bacterium]|nr:hypothetical protein [Oscillospiraceae bacterium]